MATWVRAEALMRREPEVQGWSVYGSSMALPQLPRAPSNKGSVNSNLGRGWGAGLFIRRGSED